MLRFFIEAGINRVVLVPRNETAGSGGFGIHQPVADPRYIFFSEVSRPRMLTTLPAVVHFQDVLDQLPQRRTARLNLFEQIACPCGRKFLRVLRDAAGNLNGHFPIDGSLQFLIAHILHPHLRVLLRIEVVVHAHPFVQIRGEDLIERSRQKIVLAFERSERCSDGD